MWQFLNQYGFYFFLFGMMFFMHRRCGGGCCGGHKKDQHDHQDSQVTKQPIPFEQKK